MKKLKMLLFFLTVIAIIGCTNRVQIQAEPVPEPSVDTVSVNTTSEPAVEEVAMPEVNLSCAVTADCDAGKQCIDGQCGTIDALYSTNCESKCNFEEIVISTSDNESYTLGRSQGSYTAAGALEWKLVSVPDHCAAENIPVPIKIIKKNYGRILGEQVLTLHEGETSEVVTHPAISRIAFTVRLDSVKEGCS